MELDENIEGNLKVCDAKINLLLESQMKFAIFRNIFASQWVDLVS